MDTITWEEPLTQRMKVERNLNFSTVANEDDEFGFSRKKTVRWVSPPEKLGHESNDYGLVVDGRSSEFRA
ncbi:hypothetical protein TNCV_1043541 [Trichonephila clavipes]|nr:hypothetical protein TNCV_1043541 [Trichonephila clavipes]